MKKGGRLILPPFYYEIFAMGPCLLARVALLSKFAVRVVAAKINHIVKWNPQTVE